MVYVLAVGAAFLFASGAVMQQRSASTAPPEKMLSFGLLLWLVRRKLWLAGVGTSFVGNLLVAAALGLGGVALVQPLLTVRLLFALGLSSAVTKVRPPRRDWVAAVTAMVGLGVFIAVGRPEKGEALDVSLVSWVIAGASIGGVVLLLVLVGRRLDAARQATTLALGAGILFGLQSALTEVTIERLTAGGIVEMLVSWTPYAVAAAAILGTVLLQSAYGLAPLTASYPALATIEPLAGIAIGIGVLGGVIALTPGALAVEILALALMSVGVYALATSPLVNGQLDLLEERREEGQAHRLADRLECDLEALQERLAGAGAQLDRRAPDQAEVSRLLDRAEHEMQQLTELQQDMRRHRAAERERLRDQPPELRAEVERVERDLDAREREIDAFAQRLGAELDELRARVARA